MDNMQQFITDARAKDWDDEKIKQALIASGWQEAQVDAALSGLALPLATGGGNHGHEVNQANHPSVNTLQAALQHVLLWLFTGTSTIMINIVAFALLSGNSGSSDTLLTYVVLEAVTFAAFAFFHWKYLRQLRKQPELVPGKVWSILTIVFHSLGTIGAVVGFILVLVLVHNSETTAGIVASLAIGVMDVLVVAAYALATFSKRPQSKLRLQYLRFFPVALFVIIASLGVFALFKVGPLRADDQTMQNLVTAVQDVHAYADRSKTLPENLSQLPHQPQGVSYRSTGSDTFEVCATFRVDHGDTSANDTSARQDDTYVDTSVFDNDKAGHRCWNFYDDSIRSVPVDGTPVYQ